MTSLSELISSAILELRSKFNDRVILPGDTDYDSARSVFYGGFDRRPAAIVQPENADEIAQIVEVARDAGAPLAVRSGGHSLAAHSVCDGGIVIDLGKMRGIEVDVEGRTAWAETGLTAREYTSAVAAHGLATGFGDTGSVGIGGITLGGGVGYLVRKYGLTIDDVLAAEIVTADGQILHVDADNHPDLFWAIRGGGGNFGVVTGIKYRLHEVDEIVGGMLLLPATADNIVGIVSATDAAPEELTAIINVMQAPPMPFIPVEQHGKLVIMASLCYVGPVDDAEQVLAPIRAVATPIADLVRPIRYPEMFPPDMTDYHPTAAGRTFFLDSFDRADAELIVDRLQGSSAAMAVTQLRALGGALARVPNDATAYAHRHRRLMASVAAVYQHPDEASVHTKWVEDYMAALRNGENGTYANFLGEEGHDRVREAYPGATWDRLVEVKRRYDPTNLFRLNQNIPPDA